MKSSKMAISFSHRNKLLLSVSRGETIVLQGPPGAVLRGFPPFLELEDHIEDTWVFGVKTVPQDKILFGRIAFRQMKERLSMEIGIGGKADPFSLHDVVLFPEEASSLSALRGKVLLHPGEYQLSQGAYFSEKIELSGEEGATVLSSPREVLRLENAPQAFFFGLSFFHRGTAKGNVVVVLGGKVTFERCVFAGGIQEKLSWMGNGLVVARGAEVCLRRCVFTDNQGSGIVVEKGSSVVVEDSLFFRNGKEGLSLRENSFARVFRSVFRENAWGICLLPASQGEFSASRIEANKLGGALISRGSQITFRQNTVRQHPVGVVRAPGSVTLWEGNIFAENQKDILEEG